jgi:hypothetical protein
VGGKFDLVRENMRKVSHAARERPTRVEWQFIALRNNEHEIPLARHMAGEIGINFFVKPFRVTDSALVPVDASYHSRASWRRAWKHYDVTMQTWEHPTTKSRVHDMLADNETYQFSGSALRSHLRRPDKPALQGHPVEPDEEARRGFDPRSGRVAAPEDASLRTKPSERRELRSNGGLPRSPERDL